MDFEEVTAVKDSCSPPPCESVLLSAEEAAASQDTEKTLFFRAYFPSQTTSLQLHFDFVLYKLL